MSVPPGTPLQLVDEYAAAADRFAVAVGWSQLRAPVPACPGWTVRALVVHLANVHSWAATVVETGQRAEQLDDEPRATRPRSVQEWYVGRAEDLYQVLRHVPAQQPCWNFAFGSGVAGFWARRQLHETTVHRVDLDEAAGRRSALSPLVAADGVDEVLTVMLHRMHRRGRPVPLEAPLQVTAVDTGDRWLVTPAPGGPSPSGTGPVAAPGVQRLVAGDPPAATDRVEGSAADLYRALWHRRRGGADLRVSGDAARVRRFLDARLTP